MNDKVNFIFYGEWIDYFKEMNDKEIAQTMRAIFDTVGGKSVENLKGISAVTYKVVKNQIERDVQKYREKCEKNKKNIEKRWQKDTDVIPNEYERNTNVSKKNTNVIPNGDFGMVKKSNKEKEKENEKRESKEREKSETSLAPAPFQKPTLQEVKEIAADVGVSGKEAEKFFNHYEANGWMQGGNKPVLNWVAQLNVWASRVAEFNGSGNTPSKATGDYRQREYSKEELDDLYDDLDEVEI